MLLNFRKLIFVLFCLGLLLGVVPHNPAKAVGFLIFNVNTTADGPDFFINNDCSVGHATDGPCSLRAALAEAYGNLHLSDIIINLAPETYQLTIPPDVVNNVHTGDLDIPNTDSIHKISIATIDPQNRAVIDGNQLDRVFRIGTGVHIDMKNIIVRGGLLLVSSGSFSGGAGIKNEGILHLDNVIIDDNEARSQEGADCSSINITGGAILNYGDIIMDQSTIQNNLSPNASAIFNSTGNVVIQNATIAHNQATNLWTIINYSNMHIRNSTISNNSVGNTASNYVGLVNYATLVVESSTFANAGRYAGILNTSSGDVTINDSIFMALPAPIASTCYNDDSSTWTSEGYNIFSDTPWNVITITSDLIETDPLLGFLGSWGGPTMTMPLKPASLAINHRLGDCNIKATPLTTPLNPILEYDQRFFDRNDGQCDTGAFEGSIAIFDIFLPLVSK